MNYQDYEIEDFLLDPGFRNYCIGKNGEDLLFWKDWLILHPEKYELVRQARQLYLLLNGNNTAQAYQKDLHVFREKLEQHIIGVDPSDTADPADPGKPRISPLKKRGFYAGAFAAAAAVAAVVLLLILRTEDRNSLRPSLHKPLPAEYARASNPGERKSFQLPDGTKVMLNAGSLMHLSKNFNTKDRELTLEGEAFFDVAKDALKPFVIHTAAMDITVLGTTFNVKAYPGDKSTETSLLNGSVEIIVKGGDNKKIILRPREKIIIPNGYTETPAARSRIDPALPEPYRVEKLNFNSGDSSLAEVSWTENRLAFNDNSFAEIAAALERWYNVSIQFEDAAVKDFRFTGTFDKKTIEQVLDALAASRPFEYRLEEGSKIVIRSRK
jgi:transmembrane sensor